MRYVASAYNFTVMNLVACQHQEHIYFYTIRDIMPNEELMVWYCRDFAKRLGYDIDPERATYSICKEETLKKSYALPKTKINPEVAFNHVKYVMGLHLPALIRPATPPATPSPPRIHMHHPAHQTVLNLHERSPIRIVIQENGAAAQEGGKPEKDVASPVSHSKDGSPYGEHQLTPNDGSVRSDEGYHSNGYHDDGFTPPEDSSDSESENNYVLDCSQKTIEPKETAVPQKVVTEQIDSKNDYRKVKMKMPLKYEFKNKKPEAAERESIIEQTGPEIAPATKREITPATSTVIVLETPHW